MTAKTESSVVGNGEAAVAAPVERDSRIEEPIQRAAGGFLSVSGVVRAGDVSLRNTLVGGIAAETVNVERGIVRGALAGHELRLHQAGAGMIVSGGATELRQGGAQAVISAGPVRMEQAGSGIALAREIEVGQQGTVVFGLTPRLEVREGGRVMFGPRTTLAVLGALATFVMAFVALVARRRRATRLES